jgi:hypothetical protein
MHEIGRPDIDMDRAARAEPILDAKRREEPVNLIASDRRSEPPLDQRDTRLRNSRSSGELSLGPPDRAALGSDDHSRSLDELGMAYGQPHRSEIAMGAYPALNSP